MNYEEYTDDGTMNDDEVRMLRRLEAQVVRSPHRVVQQGSGRYHIELGKGAGRWFVSKAGGNYYGDSLREVLEKSGCPWVGWEE